MTAYADAIAKPPRTLTDLEQKLILKTTGEHRDGFRDHVIISLALGTGLREHELLALDCGDVYAEDGRARRRVTLVNGYRTALLTSFELVSVGAEGGVGEVGLPLAWGELVDLGAGLIGGMEHGRRRVGGRR